MKVQVPAIELPAPVKSEPLASRPPAPMPGPTSDLVPNPPHIIDPSKPLSVPNTKPPEPEILQLKDSKFVRLTTKEAKNQQLPSYLQLELELNPLKEGETISADRDSSIRHAGKP